MADQERGIVTDIEIGTTVFDADGNELGTVRGLDKSGFYVLAEGKTDTAPITEIRDITGTAYVMWRCWECGEMGRIEAELPDQCPGCGGPKEELYYWAED